MNDSLSKKSFTNSKQQTPLDDSSAFDTYNIFENGVTASMKLRQQVTPLSTIQPDSWFNIPICVVKAFTIMIENCQNQTQIIKELNERFNERERITFSKIKRLETLIHEKDDSMHKVLDGVERNIFDKIRKIQVDVQSQLSVQEQRMREIYNNSFDDREFMHKKLNNVEDSSVIRNYIETQLISMENRFRKQQFEYRDEMDEQFNKIREDNLVIPGLVGHGESFQNLKGWVSYMSNYVQHTFNELEEKFNEKIYKDIQKSIKENNESITHFKDQIGIQVTILNDRLRDQYQQVLIQVRQEINEKLVPIRSDQSSTSNLSQYLDKKLNEMQLELQALRQNEENQASLDALKEQMANDLLSLKAKMKTKLSGLNDQIRTDFEDREEVFKKQVESLKSEIRINNQQKKDKPVANLELTDKIKRQIIDIIQNQMKIALQQPRGGGGNSQMNTTNYSSIQGGGGVNDSQKKMSAASRKQLSDSNNGFTTKGKFSLNVRRDQLQPLASNDTPQTQKKTRNSLFVQQNPNHFRARSNLDNYDSAGGVNLVNESPTHLQDNADESSIMMRTNEEATEEDLEIKSPKIQITQINRQKTAMNELGGGHHHNNEEQNDYQPVASELQSAMKRRQTTTMMNMNRTIGGGQMNKLIKEGGEQSLLLMDDQSYNFSNQNLNDISFREQKKVVEDQ